MSRSIYLVEDEKNLNALLEKYLRHEGYYVTTFLNGREAQEKIHENPDLWILDIMLPDIDGYQLIKEIKNHNSSTPVIFMSARNEELDRVVGLELGSDDYLSKPFLPRELVIRTNKLFERLNDKFDRMDMNIIALGEYSLDRIQRTVFCNNIEIVLTNKEFELLLFFINHKNILLSRDQILDKVWGDDYFGSDRVVDDTLRRLRKKVTKLNFDTVYGQGYKLVVRL